MKEYKVVSAKDSFISGTFNPEKLEKIINEYAEQGWKIVSTSVSGIPSIGNDRSEIIIIFEKEA